MGEKITILYEDADVLAINKPSGLVVHSDGRTVEPSVVDWLEKNCPEIRGVGDLPTVKGQRLSVPGAERPGIVHRLDRDTSGVLLVAKNQKTFEFLKNQFQNREVEKVYRAFVYGEMKNDKGVIDRPIARSKNNFRLWSAQRGARGKERGAVTEYKVLARKEGFSFISVVPKTGRTHQIRVHMKAINHPIVCDKLYAPKRACALGFNRLALHALSIEFMLSSASVIKIEASYPEDFTQAIKLFKFNPAFY